MRLRTSETPFRSKVCQNPRPAALYPDLSMVRRGWGSDKNRTSAAVIDDAMVTFHIWDYPRGLRHHLHEAIRWSLIRQSRQFSEALWQFP
ncbi:MAG: hypothetical protein C5S49_03315 [Candidatus Methanogaster sp.]|nr:MAG: hypothetical protein C5S49_03315 [ANME-2 cluster archaeon]